MPAIASEQVCVSVRKFYLLFLSLFVLGVAVVWCWGYICCRDSVVLW